MRQYHDMGGLTAGPIDRSEHEMALWEKRVDALLVLLMNREQPVMRVDELRRGIETLTPEYYDQLSYYERWMTSIANILVDKGVLSRAEIDARAADVKARHGKAG